MVREEMVAQLIDQHGGVQAQIIVDDALALTARMIDVVTEHWGMRKPRRQEAPPAA